MKFFHLADLHLGKLVHDFPMLEEQADALRQILVYADAEQPDAVLIAGDVFDRSVPAADALKLFDDFVVALIRKNIPVYMISGNHDSAQRNAHLSTLLAASRVHIAPAYEGSLQVHHLQDDYGPVDLVMLPFLRPNMVRPHFPGEEIPTWTKAVQAALSGVNLAPNHRAILLAHQFVTGGLTSDSEEFAIGGADNVDSALFDQFDYVALGHLHQAQRLTRDSLRYAGSPLKYSFSEARHKKSITCVELFEKGRMDIRLLGLTPLRDLKELRGTYEELMSKPFYDTLDREHYFKITLTDEQDQPDALSRLRLVYPRLMRLEYDNLRTRSASALMDLEAREASTPLDLFALLYKEQNGAELSPEQGDFLQNLMNELEADA